MSEIEALDRLIEAVEAGEVSMNQCASAFPSESAYGVCTWHHAWAAHNGSLDAALALHEALLPGWVAKVEAGGAGAGVKYSHCTVEDWGEGTEVDGNNQTTPARAWLLATLRAYRSQVAP